MHTNAPLTKIEIILKITKNSNIQISQILTLGVWSIEFDLFERWFLIAADYVISSIPSRDMIIRNNIIDDHSFPLCIYFDDRKL